MSAANTSAGIELMHPTTGDLIHELHRLSGLLESSLEELRKAAVKSARADGAYRKAYAEAYLNAREGTVRERESRAELATNEQRVNAGIASGLERAYLEGVRNYRQQMSAVQTVANAIRAEAEFARTGPT